MNSIEKWIESRPEPIRSIAKIIRPGQPIYCECCGKTRYVISYNEGTVEPLIGTVNKWPGDLTDEEFEDESIRTYTNVSVYIDLKTMTLRDQFSNTLY